MNPEALDALRHEEICAWLERALADRESLPRFTPDESPYLGILRLEQQASPATRRSLGIGCLSLLRRFCARGAGEIDFVRGLVSLAVALRQPETPETLGDLARRFPDLPDLPLAVRFTVFGALVDATPPRSPEFWEEILRHDPEQHTSVALSGVLTTFPLLAVRMLPKMPDRERTGQAAVVKLDRAWDDLPSDQRLKFAQEIQSTLPRCGQRFAGPVRDWAESKGAFSVVTGGVNPTLGIGIFKLLGSKSEPLTRHSKLCAA